MAYSGISPKRPLSYTGINNGVVPAVTRPRRPTSSDYIQPETGKKYPITCTWQVGKNPTTGSEGELWMLSKIVSNSASWLQLGAGGGGGGIASITTQNAVQVFPDGSGDITSKGAVVVNGTNSKPLWAKGTESDPTHDITLQIQIATVKSQGSETINHAGIATYNSSQFQIDSSTGLVSLLGSTTSPPILLFNLDDAQNAYADISGTVTLKGTVVNNGTHSQALFSKRSPGTNDILFDLQIAGTSTYAGKSVTKAGVVSANSAQFQVDGTTGLLSLVGSTSLAPILSITGSGGGGAISPDGSGNITFAGAGGASVSGSGSTITITAGGAGGGVTWRETVLTSDTFASGGEGIFANNASPISLTLPAAPSVGDTFCAYQEGAGIVTIHAQGSDIIRMGNQVSSAGGSISSLNQGDSIWIVAVDASRFRVINTGSWVLA